MNKNEEQQGFSRRKALKVMGTLAAGITLGTSGLCALTSCTESGKKRIVFYFTATGNSLYAAKKFTDNPISIPQVLKQKNLEFKADEIGIVYPIYGHMPPKIVTEFLDKAILKAPYKFAILTYGNRKCNATEIWNEETRQRNLPFDYITTILMVDNFLPSFDMDEQIKIDKKEDEQLARALADVNEHKSWIQPVTEEERQIHAEFMKRSGNLLAIQSDNLITIDNGKCTNCGHCVKVCPRGNFSKSTDHAVTRGDCEFCLACVHNCPHKALGLAMNERNPKARYRHPNIKRGEIIMANYQL